MENLRRIRKEKGLTQKALGEKVDVSESMIGMIENGARNPSFELLLKLGEALDCSVDDLLRGEKKPATNGDGDKKYQFDLQFFAEKAAADPDIVEITKLLVQLPPRDRKRIKAQLQVEAQLYVDEGGQQE